MTVIGSDEIRRLGYRTLADILNNARGLYASYDRNYQYVGIRGFNRPGDYNVRFLMLLDGISMVQVFIIGGYLQSVRRTVRRSGCGRSV